MSLSGGRTTREGFFFPSLFLFPPLHALKALMYTKENLCNHIKRSWGEYNQASFSITIRRLFCKTCGEAFDLYFYANAGVLLAPVGKCACGFFFCCRRRLRRRCCLSAADGGRYFVLRVRLLASRSFRQSQRRGRNLARNQNQKETCPLFFCGKL